MAAALLPAFTCMTSRSDLAARTLSTSAVLAALTLGALPLAFSSLVALKACQMVCDSLSDNVGWDLTGLWSSNKVKMLILHV